MVLDRDGLEIATATLPAGFAVHHIGDGFVLGVRRDEIGVESVLEYRLVRTS